MSEKHDLDLITLVVQHKDEKKTLWTLKEAQVPGVTYFYGRGTGVRQRLGVLGNLIEAEKVIFITAVPPALTEPIVRLVTEKLSLDKPGNGFLCVQRVQQVVGYI